jgi:hypothetical protein
VKARRDFMQGKKLILQGLLILFIALLLASCGEAEPDQNGVKQNQDEPNQASDFYGVWTASGGHTFTISATEITWRSGISDSYHTFTISFITPAANGRDLHKDGYPNGYNFFGSVTYTYPENITIIQSVITLFLHTNQGSIQENASTLQPYFK